ncbi:MAG: acetylserotonin O-methyltransferase [Sedimentisphaerales bacterium]|nr:acetylserotonin O-methyltransferase [Sedimentisphaerales bacterium]
MTKHWTADEVLDMVRAFQPACVLVAAAELDVFTVVSKKPMTAKSLAAKLDCDLRAIAVILDALSALGFLTKQKNKYSVPKKMRDLLAESGAHNVLPGVRHLGNTLRRWVQLAQVTKTGKPAERVPSIRGASSDLAAFIGAMNNFSDPIADQIIDKLKPLKFRHLLDIGGAAGSWTVAFLCAAPNAKATLFDLPDVIPLAKWYIAKNRMRDRVALVAGDFEIDDLPAGADFAWLSAVAHQNSRKQNRALFTKIHSALQEQGVLVIRDVTMYKSRTYPVTGALFAINMLVGTEEGGTYTFEEFREDLSKAGFAKVTLIHRDEAMNSLIHAEKSRQ